MSKAIVWVSVLSIAVLGAVVADDEELSPAETIKLLERIEGLREKIDESRYGEHASAIQAYRNAAESAPAAYEFYVRCYKEVRFERRGARESEYREWRSKNAQWLRSKEHSEARRLQLEYLVLTLRAAQSKRDERDKMVPELTALIDASIAAYPSLGRGQEILIENAIGSIFGQVYDLEGSLKWLSNWGDGPLDIAGIYDKAILPLYRSSAKADDLAKAWDRRISQETQLVALSENPDAEDRFVSYTLPLLRWNKNLDLLKAGKRRTALNAMIELLQKNVRHEDVDSWLSEVSAYLNGEEELPDFDTPT